MFAYIHVHKHLHTHVNRIERQECRQEYTEPAHNYID